MTWKVVVQPTAEPISLAEARLHLRLTTDDSPPSHPDDSLVLALITGARQHCENLLGRSLAPQVIEVVIDEFPEDGIEIPMCPIRSVESVKYVDEDGNQQTLNSSLYVLDNEQEPSWVLPVIDTAWPTTAGVVNGVRVRVNAGYTNANSSDSPTPDNDLPIPEVFKRAMLLLVAHWYENREAVITGTISTTLDLAVKTMLAIPQLRTGMA